MVNLMDLVITDYGCSDPSTISNCRFTLGPGAGKTQVDSTRMNLERFHVVAVFVLDGPMQVSIQWASQTFLVSLNRPLTHSVVLK